MAAHFHYRVVVFEAGHAFLIGFDVTHIARVALRRIRRPMLRSGRIEMPAGRRAVLRAAIVELMNVKAVLARLQTFDLRHYFDVGYNMSKSHSAVNLVILGRFDDG